MCPFSTEVCNKLKTKQKPNTRNTGTIPMSLPQVTQANDSHPAPIALGMGANLGTPAETFARAVSALADAGLDDIVLSPLYRTAPVDCVPGTPPFTNAALMGTWSAHPTQLLETCQTIERQLGRPANHSSHESRVVDLDILLFGRIVLESPELTIPHPRLCERLFVLAPLADIAPDVEVPGTGRSVRELRDALMGTPQNGTVERIP